MCSRALAKADIQSVERASISTPPHRLRDGRPFSFVPCSKPISVHWDVYGNIFVLEKAGIIKRVNSWIGTAVDVVLDISAHVSAERGRAEQAPPPWPKQTIGCR